MSNKNYGLELIYVAPQNATDEKGIPVQVFYRYIALDEKAHEVVVNQMKEKETDIFIPTKAKFSDDSEVDNVTFVNLKSQRLMKASTFSHEILNEEEVKAKGKPVIYKADGEIASIN